MAQATPNGTVRRELAVPTQLLLRPFRSVPFLILLILLSITAAIYQYGRNLELARGEERFANAVRDFQHTLSLRLARHGETLHLLKAAVELSATKPAPDWWRQLVGHIDLAASLPGTQALGYSRFMLDAELPGFVANVQNVAYADFAIWPQGPRDWYLPVYMLEPLDERNLRALGWDIYSEPIRRAAIDAAVRTGEPAISGRLTLVTEESGDPQPGFMLFVPVRESVGAASAEHHPLPGHEDGSEQRSVGMIYVAARAREFLGEVLRDQAVPLQVRVFDQADWLDGGPPLFESFDNPIQWSSAGHATDIEVPAANRTWHVQIASTQNLGASTATISPGSLAVAGTSISLLAFALALALYGRGQYVEQRANEIAGKLAQQSSRLQVAQQADAFGTWELNLKSREVRWDEQMYNIYGVSPELFANNYDAWFALVLPADLPMLETAFSESLETGEPFDSVFRIQHPALGIRHIQTRATLVRNQSDTPTHMIGVSRDITRDREVLEQAQLAANVFSFADEGIMITDAERRIIDVNNTFTRITGYTREEAIGRNPSILQSGLHSRTFYDSMEQSIRETGHWSGEICNRRKNGELYHELLHVSEIRNGNDEVVSYIGIFSDISASKKHQEDLRHMALHDPLTDLPNRHQLQQDIERQIRRARNSLSTRVGFLYIDLDYFREINDRYGHMTGDRMLVEVARRLISLVRHPNSIARIGGDEFVAVFELGPEQSIDPNIDQILDALSQPFSIQGVREPIEISASIGVSFYPEDETNPDALLRQADKAMYDAKLSGRDRVVRFDSHHERATKQKNQLLNEVMAGIGNGEFELYFQPKVNLSTRQPVGFEALIRWNHPERGLLLPGAFIRETDSSDVCIDLGAWVMRAAMHAVKKCAETNLPLTFSVNVAARHIIDPRFIDLLRQLRDEFGADAMSLLELEVLESFPLGDAEQATIIMQRCREFGVRFAIDDFGTGYSSLTYLSKLPVETLKIDQSFVISMTANEFDRSIVEAVIGIGEALELEVVAEGVETEEAAKELVELGCETAQGYLFAKPMPFDEACAWCMERLKPA